MWKRSKKATEELARGTKEEAQQTPRSNGSKNEKRIKTGYWGISGGNKGTSETNNEKSWDQDRGNLQNRILGN